MRTLVPIAAVAASVLIPGAAHVAAASVPTHFYCTDAKVPTVCEPYPPAWSTTTTRKIDITVTRHASLGERCLLYIDGIGPTKWVYINETDSSMHYLGTVPGHTGFNLRCQRRDNSGSAEIAGNVYQLA